MDAAALLVEHARPQRIAWRVGDLEVPIATLRGVRGHPGVDGALLALAPALRRGRVAPAGRALDLSGGPAALPAWSAAAGRDVRWTVALTSVAGWRAAEATLAGGPAGGATTLAPALPWEVEGVYDTIVWRPPADRGAKRLRAELEAVAARVAPDGTVVLLQHKDEGAQRQERAAAERFEGVETVGREAGWRVTLLRGPRPAAGAPAPHWSSFEAPGGAARAIVGTFAAEKLDPGTAALLRALAGEGLAAAAGARLLDLGSGTGLLARAALAVGAAAVVASDDDLGAVRSTAAQLGLDAPAAPGRARVVHANLLDARDPGEAAALRHGSFDLVWCNPPFHVGRQVVGALSRAFVAAAFAALRPGGVAWFVVNRGLPYEREFAAWGRYADATPAGERTFTVWRVERGDQPSAAPRSRAGAAPSTS